MQTNITFFSVNNIKFITVIQTIKYILIEEKKLQKKLIFTMAKMSIKLKTLISCKKFTMNTSNFNEQFLILKIEHNSKKSY